jgi:hypothetical protein
MISEDHWSARMQARYGEPAVNDVTYSNDDASKVHRSLAWNLRDEDEQIYVLNIIETAGVASGVLHWTVCCYSMLMLNPDRWNYPLRADISLNHRPTDTEITKVLELVGAL